MRPNQLNGSGGTAPLTYALQTGGNAATAGIFGTIQVNTDGTYSYTLTAPFDTTPDADNGANTEVAESFSYVVTDANGNTATGTITVDIVDDVPTATAEHRQRGRGRHRHRQRADRRHRRRVRGGRCGDDVPAGGVAGVAAGSDTPMPVIGGVGGRGIAGSFGTLTLNADGSYSYDGDPNVVPPAGATDTFVYTITDGDGDTSTTTLTINLTDCGLAAANDDDVTVNEAALRRGSDPSSTAETVTGTVADNCDARRHAPLTYALLSSRRRGDARHADRSMPDGTYSYTLTSPFDTARTPTTAPTRRTTSRPSPTW